MEKKELKKIVAAEYKKCARNPIHFFNKFVKIQHPQRGTLPFALYKFQERTLRELKNNDYNIILKSRQMGISTLTAAYALWMMVFHSDKSILVIATTQATAKNIITKVRFMNDKLPSWLRVEPEEDNKLSLRLINGSQIKAVSSKIDATRSESLSLLIIDEAAFVPNIDETWIAAQQTLATGGQAIVLSTPNGIGNWFHKQWMESNAGENKFNTIKLHWSLHPDRDAAWRKEQDKLLGEKAAQECDCDFLSSGRSVIPPEILKWYQDNLVTEPILKRAADGNLWVWAETDYSKDYIVVADVARGDGSDFSACHVIDVESLEQVAEYRGKISTKDYGKFLVSLSTEYNNALLVIENNSIGWAAIQSVLDTGYKNLFYSSKDLNLVDPSVQLNQSFDLKSKNKLIPGFTVTSKNRPLLVEKLGTFFMDKAVIARSKRLIDELFVFVWNDGDRAEAQRGYNDDLTMSFAMALFIRDTALRLRMEGINMQRSIINNIHKTEPDTVYTNNSVKRDQWEMDTGRGKEDISWLLGSKKKK